MKTQKLNTNNLNPMQMNSMSSMMGMMNYIQKIGKGKRKYTVTLTKNTKKFLSRFIDEVKKQFSGNNGAENVTSFLNYVKEIAEAKGKMELRLSYEELEFLTRMVSDSVKGMESIQYKWYQFIKKGVTMALAKQYRELLVQLKK